MSIIGPHHAYRKKIRSRSNRNFSRLSALLDDSIYVIGAFALLANIPQLWNIWVKKQTAGVSVISWIGFFVGSLFWLGYGILHKEKPIIVINFVLIFIQAGVVLGLLLISR